MRFEDERYVRVYTRDTMTMLMLSWEARSVFWETLRKVDRAGIIELGEDGVDGLAAMIRIPPEVTARAVSELSRRRVIELREDGVLVVPRFVEAQEAKASDKARQRASRERARDGARAVSLGLPAPTAAQAQNDTPRDAAVPERDSPVTPNPESERPRHADSNDVTLSRTEPSRAVPEEHSQSEHSDPPAKPASRRAKGTRLPEDWQPSPELLAKLRSEFKIDPTPSIRRFKNYWLNATRNAVKPRWDLAFENWVERDANDGKLAKLDEDEFSAPLLQLPNREKYLSNEDTEGMAEAAQGLLGVNLGVAR